MTPAHLATEGVSILEGPVTKSGALGPLTSVDFIDPDGNLIEIGRYAGASGQADQANVASARFTG